MSRNQLDDEGFRLFANTLTEIIQEQQRKEGILTETQLLEKQCKQFQELVALELQFRDLMTDAHYEMFIHEVCVKRGNILTSRPFFRQRQEVCIGPVAQALKRRDIPALRQFHPNYNLISLILNNCQCSQEMKSIGKKIKDLRELIVVSNMPLAISQARIFYSKAPTKTNCQRWSFLDYLQTSADGLLSAVDKMVLPPGLESNPALIRVWRSVAIGRARGLFIELFSSSDIHFYPQDRRKLYRANKHMKDFQGRVDFEQLAQRVNNDLGPNGPKTDSSELSNLMSAAASSIQSGNEDEDGPLDTPLTRAAADTDWQPDVRAEKAETLSLLSRGIKSLNLLEQKLIRLQGVAELV